ncbi:DUF4383 domain-containing protein [Candidatus Woesearchaeota archaeon]|nr:DUF4383 domain-containing protein [Candidatus Woesearchaeota archaeon]
MADTQKTFAKIVGVVLILLGLIGFFSNPVLGYFGVNSLQNIVHLIGGVLGLVLANKGSGKAFNKWLGIIGVILAILGFIPSTAALLLSVLGINQAITVLHLIVGVVALGVAYGVKE